MLKPSIRGYGEATIGLAFIGETDVLLSAPAVNFTADASDFYDRTAAFTFGVNVGALFDFRERSASVPEIGVFAQLGLRYVSGMSDVDAFVGTGLESINDSSSRWALPFTVGVRVRFSGLLKNAANLELQTANFELRSLAILFQVLSSKF